MLTHEEICTAIAKTAKAYPIKKVEYFGSYAEGKATSGSDLDLLIEFHKPRVSLFVLSAIKLDLQDLLNVQVDVVHAPIISGAIIQPKEVILAYG